MHSMVMSMVMNMNMRPSLLACFRACVGSLWACLRLPPLGGCGEAKMDATDGCQTRVHNTVMNMGVRLCMNAVLC